MCATLLACEPSSRPPRDSGITGDIAFVDVTVLPMTQGEETLARQTVLVSGDSIVAIGATADVQVQTDATIVNGAGRFLMPGLTDMHVHLEYSEDPRILDLFLANGVTTVRNMDGRPYILEWRDLIERGEMLGPGIYTAGPILDGDPPVREDNLAIGSADEAREAVRAQAAAGYDFVKSTRISRRPPMRPSSKRPPLRGWPWRVTSLATCPSKRRSRRVCGRSNT